MAKRFYDSKKYDDNWYRNLSPDLKCVYDYCLCVCDYAGILKLDVEDMEFRIKPKDGITLSKIQEAFKDKFLFLSNCKVFIPKFIYWQYKNELMPSNSVHRAVYNRFKEEGISIDPYLAQYVLKSDFEDWKELWSELNKQGKKYKELLKEREESK